MSPALNSWVHKLIFVLQIAMANYCKQKQITNSRQILDVTSTFYWTDMQFFFFFFKYWQRHFGRSFHSINYACVLVKLNNFNLRSCWFTHTNKHNRGLNFMSCSASVCSLFRPHTFSFISGYSPTSCVGVDCCGVSLAFVKWLPG